jgi:two-component system, OmpR family, KDP operon response regulator KdpE
MTNGRVLVVDDEEQIRRAVGRALSSRGYLVEQAADGEQALSAAAAFDPELVVLDLNMPVLDGFAVCRELRRTSAVPILVLSVREDASDKVEALDLGADDYLTKPFSVDELMARVRAVFRRANPPEQTPTLFRTDGLEIDVDAHRVTRDGDDLRLTKTEWALLETLSERPGKLLTHGWLLERVWGADSSGDVEVLRVFISQLRRKIERDPGRPAIIGTDPGIGYRWLLQPAGGDAEA